MRRWQRVGAALVVLTSVFSEGEPPVKWSYATGGDSIAPLAFSEGVVYAASSGDRTASDSNLFALDAYCGDVLWNTGTGTAGVLQPKIVGEGQDAVLYSVAGTESNPLVAVVRAYNLSSDLGKGSERLMWAWGGMFEHPMSSVEASIDCPLIFVVSGTVLFALQNNSINTADSVETPSGVLVWSWSPTKKTKQLSQPVLWDSKVLLVVSDSGLYALNATAMEKVPPILWAVTTIRPLPEENSPVALDPPPYIDEDFAYLASGDYMKKGNNSIFALNVNKGSVLWTVGMDNLGIDGAVPSMPVAKYGKVFFTTKAPGVQGNNMWALNSTTGSPLWNTTVHSGSAAVWSRATVGNQLVYAVDYSEGHDVLYAFSEDTGKVQWSAVMMSGQPPLAPFSEWPISVGDDVYFGTSDNAPTVYDFGAVSLTMTPTATKTPTVTESITISQTVQIITGTRTSTTTSTLVVHESESQLHEILLIGGVCLGSVLLLFCASYIKCKRKKLKGADSVMMKYKIVRKLGSGAYGVVYLVRRRSDNELFAMKYLQCGDDQAQEEALNEFKLIRAFQGHPNMIEVVETFMSWNNSPPRKKTSSTEEEEEEEEEDQRPFLDSPRYVCLVMPYYRKGDLRSFVLNYPDEVIPEELLLNLAEQLCSLLHHLHYRMPPLIHRDLKPENILIADDGRPIVTDFGLAKNLESMYCSTRAGTAAFLAPECWSKHYGVEVDIWALGCILYSCATKRVRSSNTRIMFADAMKPDFLSGIAEELKGQGYSDYFVSIVKLLLQPDYHHRPRAADVGSSLRKRRTMSGVGEDTAYHGMSFILPEGKKPQSTLQVPSEHAISSVADSQETIVIGDDEVDQALESSMCVEGPLACLPRACSPTPSSQATISINSDDPNGLSNTE
eukprot:TRINITY_DN13422_c0_g2_i3.p1 TRINITY_DN13422_c0_g2~~TRINITY_DN13422_c0_g2_i3.p1  ORF type:complete len:896 (+),score=262.34 TRINITY_DN13422_c0_g2_i3:4646-7333(+)